MGVLRGLCPFKRGLGETPSFKFPPSYQEGGQGDGRKGILGHPH
jgi:hypothetical protein